MKFFCALNIASGLAWAALGYVVGPSWLGMICAALVGQSVGSALWIAQCYRWRSLFEQAQAGFKDMADINEALIHDRVMFHFFGESPPMDPADDHKPRLH